MAENKVINAIKFFKKSLKETGLKVSRVILFGSQAKGKATKESDVDIVIISDAFKGKDIFERAQLTKDAEIKTIKKFLIPLDILTMTPEEWKRNKAMLI
jgi:predicted nucleotidyltransferase